MPSTDKRPLKVFLCHAHSDAPAVRALYNRLCKGRRGRVALTKSNFYPDKIGN